MKALVLLLAFAATLLAGAERIYVANTGGADISVIEPTTNSVIGVIRVSKHPHAIVASTRLRLSPSLLVPARHPGRGGVLPL